MAGKKKNNLEEAPKRRPGGPQPGSGRPAGSLGLKARTLLEVKNRIAQKADHLLNAEFLEALGSFVVMKADPETLEYQRVTDENEIVRFIQEHKGANGQMDGKVYILTAKQGNYKSRQYLFDRAFGRPQIGVEVSQPGDADVIRLKAAIEKRAQEKGIPYVDEVQNYLEHYADDVRREIKEQLEHTLNGNEPLIG